METDICNLLIASKIHASKPITAVNMAVSKTAKISIGIVIVYKKKPGEFNARRAWDDSGRRLNATSIHPIYGGGGNARRPFTIDSRRKTGKVTLDCVNGISDVID